ncbi:hypothetical protein [Methylogaea oryzae]|uniref:hypothetical protein n=1 Tax=Methylogaea oryzae TaxID=1295382 RepID=UPI00138ED3C9|nr:hypothetical protein [Methylogaea oryzae]
MGRDVYGISAAFVSLDLVGWKRDIDLGGLGQQQHRHEQDRQKTAEIFGEKKQWHYPVVYFFYRSQIYCHSVFSKILADSASSGFSLMLERFG